MKPEKGVASLSLYPHRHYSDKLLQSYMSGISELNRERRMSPVRRPD